MYMLENVREEGNEYIPDIAWRVWNKWYYYRAKRVTTEYGHSSKARCCKSGCTHCPFLPRHSGSDQLDPDLKRRMGYRIGPID